MTLEKICKSLLINQPFWGLFLLGLNKKHTTSIPTLAVASAGLGVQLLINDTFWDSLTNEQQKAVLIHELHHIALNHITMGKNFPDRERFNVAADLEVNCYINDLPEGCLLVKDFGLPEKKGTLWYYNNLKGNPMMKQLSSQGDGSDGSNKQVTLDDHSTWRKMEDLSNAEKDLLRGQVEGMLKQAAIETQKSRGTIPGALAGIIDDLLMEKPRVYNWRAALRRAMGTEIDTRFKKTYQRESKRFTGSPGLRMMKKIRVLVGVDTSGSIGDDELVDFFSEINHMYKAGVSAHIVECDADIHNEWDYKGPRNITITGRGGTDFQPLVDYYRKRKKEFTTFVMFTDGCAPVNGLNVPNNEMTWVISGRGEHKDYPGKTIYMPRTDY